MFKPTALRLVTLLASAGLGSAGAACVIQTPTLVVSTYRATDEARGRLSLHVLCDGIDALKPYTLRLSAFGGQFDQASGSFVFGALGRAGSVLKMQILGAAPALGGTLVPTVYTGSQDLDFLIAVPAGQWQVSGTPTINLNFDLSPYATGSSLP